jgi:pyrimidine operon attenuation protein/uracil phosphoribosyltransferase
MSRHGDVDNKGDDRRLSSTSSASHPHEVAIMDAAQMTRTLTRMAHEILEKNPDEQSLAVIGIHTRGAVLAQRLRDLLAQLSGRDVPLGTLDISFYRDDVAVRGEAWMLPAGRQPEVRGTELPFGLDGTTIVLVDRGHRELPIRPDYVGKNIPTSLPERVSVRVTERDGTDAVVLVRSEEGAER